MAETIEELIPTSPRNKRGLINALGGAIKVITGNLDAEDARIFQMKIEELTKNQRKIIKSEKETISLTVNAINNFNQTIKGLIRNQHTLERKVNQITEYLNAKDFMREKLHHMHITLIEIVNSLNEILRVLTNIQTAISFAKLNFMHSNILTPKELKNELIEMKSEIIPYKLPLEPELQNIPIIESLISIKAYSVESQIIFLMEIPLVTDMVYNFVKVYSIPIFLPSQNAYQTIIPTYNSLLVSEQFYTTPKDCKNIESLTYLCENNNLLPANEESPCIIQLINTHKNLTSCKPTRFQLTKNIITKINTNTWILVFTAKTKIQIHCLNDFHNQIIQGTFIVTILDHCYLQINNITLKSQDNFSRVKLLNISIFDFKTNFMNNNNNALQAVNLENILLDNNQEVKQRLMKLEEDLPDDEDFPIVHGLNTWTIILYIIIFAMCLFLCYRKYSKCKGSKKPTKDKNSTTGADNVAEQPPINLNLP